MSARRKRVDRKKNSVVGTHGVKLTDLDFANWFTDTSYGRHYLHVDGPDGTLHRVHCRHADNPRLEMHDGVLYWLLPPRGNAR